MKNLFCHTDMARAALISDCGRYRWTLTRSWRPDADQLGWIMLNPSTADALDDDPTIRRCMGFARDWGFGGIFVVNLFPLRATDPSELTPDGLPEEELPAVEGIIKHAVGPLDSIVEVFRCPRIMAAWGSHTVVHRTHRDILARTLAADRRRVLHCLSVNSDGQPRHPLYVARKAEAVVWFDGTKVGGSR